MPSPKKSYDQVRVIANTQEGLYVLDAKGGRMQVFAANIALRAGKPPVMQLNLLAQTFSVQGSAQFLVQDPVSGQPKAVKSVTWWDGTVAEFAEPKHVEVAMQPPPGGPPSADPAGAKPITPVANGNGVREFPNPSDADSPIRTARGFVDWPDGTPLPEAPPPELPFPPPGKRWETNAEFAARIGAERGDGIH